MPKRDKGCCKKCGRNVGEENLSNQNQCYDCAKKAMIEMFDRIWNASHPKRE